MFICICIYRHLAAGGGGTDDEGGHGCVRARYHLAHHARVRLLSASV